MSLLESINSPSDLENLTIEELSQLAAELRTYIIDVVSRNGGHLAPSLGVVELTLALHKVFHTPLDKIIFDVGHQSYVHKIITGRRKEFLTLRQYGGLSGFPKRSESEHDAFGTGHSSTSISAALGMAIARDLQGLDYNVVAVIGDGSMTGGMAFEAMNNAGDLGKRLIVVLNDNEMSISKNVGAMSSYLTSLRTGETYLRVRDELEAWLRNLDIGNDVIKAINRIKGSAKYLLTPFSLFEELGFHYYGPVDGHDLESLINILQAAKKINGPVLIHVLTKKGKGYEPAEKNPNKFHGTGPFAISDGSKLIETNAAPTYTEVFGKTLIEIAASDEKIVAITAAMPDGTGLQSFAQKFPQRFFDVGIAEQHAVTLAAGMAAAGLKPVAAIYSTFLQRAYDSVLHDICMQNLHVVLCLDRAGLVGDDGYTHHGVFDLAFLRSMPNMTIMTPQDEAELQQMLRTALAMDGPVALRYPRGCGRGVPLVNSAEYLPIGKAEVVLQGSKKARRLAIWALGSMVEIALTAAKHLEIKEIGVTVVNMRFAKPLDKDLLCRQAQQYKNILVLEEGVVAGGIGSAIMEMLNQQDLLSCCRVLTLGIPDKFVTHGAKNLLLRELGLDAESVAKEAQEFFFASDCGEAL